MINSFKIDLKLRFPSIFGTIKVKFVVNQIDFYKLIVKGNQRSYGRLQKLAQIKETLY